jgi:hypothetical protein
MPLHNKSGTTLMITMICVVSTSVGLAAEPTVSKTSVRNRQTTQTQVETPSAAPKVTAVSYSTIAEMQDSVVDGTEAVRCRTRDKTSRLYRESLIARAHRQKQECFRVEHGNLRDWTNYIRGYGPTVWVRNGPECGIHPPSIPFAKRVGGYNAPAWQGVTGVPKQPEISPLSVNAPPESEMNY